MNSNNHKSVRLYHFTHYENLSKIISHGLLCSREDPQRKEVGDRKIKNNRLNKEVPIFSGTGLCVGDFVPFYFFAPTPMLYRLIDRGVEQESLVYLVVHLHEVIDWAEENNVCWAITDDNAAGKGANFSQDIESMDITPENFKRLQNILRKKPNHPEVKNMKQMEFLIHKNLPWNLIKGVAVYSQSHYNTAVQILNDSDARGTHIATCRHWYVSDWAVANIRGSGS